MKKILLLLFISTMIISCHIRKPLLKNIEDIDKNTPIYFSGGDDLIFYNIKDSLEIQKYKDFSTTISLDPRLNNLVGINYNYSLNSKSHYTMTSNTRNIKINTGFGTRTGSTSTPSFNRQNVLTSQKTNSALLKFYNFETKKLKSEIPINTPFRNYSNELYELQWSLMDSNFYMMNESSIFKSNTAGQKEKIISLPSLKDFSVSNDGNNILIYHSDSISIYNIPNKKLKNIKVIDTFLGLPEVIKCFPWSRDSRFATFSKGFSIYTYDIKRNKVLEYKAKKEVFDIEWVNNHSIIFVEGSYPSPLATLHRSKNFRIVYLDLLTQTKIMLHSNASHSPLLIKPQISPSKKLILFSERKLNGVYQVQLMSLDGKNIKVIGEGEFPYWLSEYSARKLHNKSIKGN